jgi:transcriptional regulator with XRE-family HTH domain
VWISQREYKWLGAMLLAAREDVGLTQKVLAKRLRKPQSFVSSYERGQRRVDILEFIRICAAIGIDPARLFAKVTKQ